MEKAINRILRGQNITIGVTITAVILLIGIVVILFYRPTPKGSAVEAKNDAIEQLRQAELMKVNANLDSIRIDNKISDETSHREKSEFIKALNENTKTFKQIRDEKPINYSDFNSIQLQRTVSNVVRQYKSGQ